MSTKTKTTINITVIDNETKKLYNKIQEAEKVSGTRNFYIFEDILENRDKKSIYKAYSLTAMPSGIAIMHFKYKKDAVNIAKKLNESNIDFGRSIDEFKKDKELYGLMLSIIDELNKNGKRAGSLRDFPV